MNSVSAKKEIWGRIIIRVLYYYQFVCVMITSLQAKLYCFFWKISIGNGCRFYGISSWWRAPDSSIIIGKNCTFRSNKTNRLGINRPCMISTVQNHAKIIIGDNNGFSGTVIVAATSVTIGSDVLCGTGVTITDTDSHHTNPDDRKNKNLAPPLIPCHY